MLQRPLQGDMVWGVCKGQCTAGVIVPVCL